MYTRSVFTTVLKRMAEPRRFIQVLAGPRQVGKTTLAKQVTENLKKPFHYASADGPELQQRTWIEQQWETARLLHRKTKTDVLLILDEIQKLPAWSESVKQLWDEDTFQNTKVKVILLGSSPLLLRKGLSESLSGRFETIHLSHWSWPEMKAAFHWNLDQYVYYGGYPGAAPLIEDDDRWRNYIRESLIETTVARDILLMTRVDKPALLRQLFHLGCTYSGKIMSYQKMLGQLQDAGNTTTLSHYLDLLTSAGMVSGISKYSPHKVRQRASSPKFQALNTALVSVQQEITYAAAREDRTYWGQLVETTVGAHLFNSSQGANPELYYWRENNQEVDFVLVGGKNVVAIEVKSGRLKVGLPGMDTFKRNFKPKRMLLVGKSGIALDEFLSYPAGEWVG